MPLRCLRCLLLLGNCPVAGQCRFECKGHQQAFSKTYSCPVSVRSLRLSRCLSLQQVLPCRKYKKQKIQRSHPFFLIARRLLLLVWAYLCLRWWRGLSQYRYQRPEGMPLVGNSRNRRHNIRRHSLEKSFSSLDIAVLPVSCCGSKSGLACWH